MEVNSLSPPKLLNQSLPSDVSRIALTKLPESPSLVVKTRATRRALAAGCGRASQQSLPISGIRLVSQSATTDGLEVRRPDIRGTGVGDEGGCPTLRRSCRDQGTLGILHVRGANGIGGA